MAVCTEAINLFRQAANKGMELDPHTVLHVANSWGTWSSNRNNWNESADAYRLGLGDSSFIFTPG